MKRRGAFTLIELPVVRKRAFTLIELLIVVAIIAIIASFIVVMIKSTQSHARDTKRAADLELLDSAINRYYRETGHFPDLPAGCGAAGINGVSSNQVLSMAAGNCLTADFIAGLAPKYTPGLPTDPGPALLQDGKNARGFAYIHSNQNTQNLECYKIIALNPESPKAAGYKSIWDPARDGGSDPSSVDGTTTTAWAKYSRGCAVK